MIKDTIIEILIGIKIDAEFGPVIVIGAGGVFTELDKGNKNSFIALNKKRYQK